MEDKEIIPAGAKSTASCVPFGKRKLEGGGGRVGSLVYSPEWDSPGHISDIRDVFLFQPARERKPWHDLPLLSVREKQGKKRSTEN